jgi:hypothetical protein
VFLNLLQTIMTALCWSRYPFKEYSLFNVTFIRFKFYYYYFTINFILHLGLSLNFEKICTNIIYLAIREKPIRIYFRFWKLKISLHLINKNSLKYCTSNFTWIHLIKLINSIKFNNWLIEMMFLIKQLMIWIWIWISLKIVWILLQIICFEFYVHIIL